MPIESASDNQGAISQTLQLLNELLREAPVIVMDNAEASQAKVPLQGQGNCGKCFHFREIAAWMA